MKLPMAPLLHTSARVLEFESLRDMLRAYAGSPLGHARLAALAPSTEHAWIARQQQLTAESLDQLSLSEGFSELGRFLVTREPKDVGAFKTPPLRDIELTAPYMHDGSQKTLREVIDFYNKGGEPNPNLDGGIRKLDLTDQEISDLEAFLKSLTSDRVRKLVSGES